MERDQPCSHRGELTEGFKVAVPILLVHGYNSRIFWSLASRTYEVLTRNRGDARFPKTREGLVLLVV